MDMFAIQCIGLYLGLCAMGVLVAYAGYKKDCKDFEDKKE